MDTMQLYQTIIKQIKSIFIIVLGFFKAHGSSVPPNPSHPAHQMPGNIYRFCKYISLNFELSSNKYILLYF